MLPIVYIVERKMIKSLKIENFKGFSELALSGLKRITLLGGANNVGKSSVLESVFLLYSSRQQNFFTKQHHLRDVIGGGSWSDFFYNLDTDKTIQVSVNDEDTQYTLKCAIKEGFHPDAHHSQKYRGLGYMARYTFY